MQLNQLLTPIALRDLELANRIVISPLCQFSAVDGTAQPWHWMHVGSFAVSGAGLLIMEATGVSDIGRITPGCLGLYSDENEVALTRLLRDVRTFSDMPIGIQLSHAGRKASTRPTWELWKGSVIPRDEGGWSVIGPSSQAYTEGWPVPAELDETGLREVIAQFVASTKRADRCGFGLIEIHAAHGYLLHQFLSPLTNHRQDRYGGSAEARMQFPLEVAKAMREAWPEGKPMGMRITGEDWNEGGLTLDDAVMLADALKEIGFDYVTPSAGNVAPGMKLPQVYPGYMAGFSEHIRSKTSIATMAVGMIIAPDQANELVTSGKADMACVGRGFMDDPRWAWHAAAALEGEAKVAPQYARATPKHWPAYPTVHGTRRREGDGIMGHAIRD
jgi:2,4-dienoyl-CoA reductase-like NADH-dependent reductase (Old Yellow Enzyme family)